MKLLLVSINDPSKEKLVTDILQEIDGVTVRPGPKKAGTASSGSKKTQDLTPKEKKFVNGLKQAFKEMDEHIAGKRKFKSLKEVLATSA